MLFCRALFIFLLDFVFVLGLVGLLHRHPVEILELVWNAAHRFRRHVKHHGNSKSRKSAVQVTLIQANAQNFENTKTLMSSLPDLL